MESFFVVMEEVTYTLWWGEAGRSIARMCVCMCVCVFSVCMCLVIRKGDDFKSNIIQYITCLAALRRYCWWRHWESWRRWTQAGDW